MLSRIYIAICGVNSLIGEKIGGKLVLCPIICGTKFFPHKVSFLSKVSCSCSKRVFFNTFLYRKLYIVTGNAEAKYYVGRLSLFCGLQCVH